MYVQWIVSGLIPKNNKFFNCQCLDELQMIIIVHPVYRSPAAHQLFIIIIHVKSFKQTQRWFHSNDVVGSRIACSCSHQQWTQLFSYHIFNPTIREKHLKYVMGQQKLKSFSYLLVIGLNWGWHKQKLKEKKTQTK